MRDLEDLNSSDLSRYDDLAEHLSNLPGTPDFKRAAAYFETYPERSLVNSYGRAFLYQLVRSLRPELVLEIGTYAAGTTEVLARALWANDAGGVLTIDPFGADRAPRIFSSWPEELAQRVIYRTMFSMECFNSLKDLGSTPEMVFIDGNHDYGYALFDLNMAAECVRPGGVIVMDNAEQPGVFWSAMHFAERNPAWHVLGDVYERHDAGDPFASMGVSVPHTAFIVLIAPRQLDITETPQSIDFGRFPEVHVEGFEIDLVPGNGAGRLHIQSFLRAFPHDEKDGLPFQFMALSTFPIEAGAGAQFVALAPPETQPDFDPARSYRMCEVILAWEPEEGAEPLRLKSRPTLVKSGDPAAVLVAAAAAS